MTEYCLPRPKGRRTRKGSAQPHQSASSSQPALPAKQFHHNVEASGQVMAGSTSSNSLKRVSKVNEIEGSSNGSKQEKLSWVVILLLVGLIAFNVILYVKLWRLDEHQDAVENDFLGRKMEFLR